MKLLNCSSLICMVAFLFVQTAISQQFTPQGEGFTVWLNGKPSPQSQTVESAVGKITIKLYLVSGPSGTHGISINQYPIATEDAQAIENRLNAGVESMLKGQNAKKLTEKVVYLNENKGKEVTFSSAKGYGKIKVFLIKYNLYQVISIGDNKYVNSPAMTKFFNSFKLAGESMGEKWSTFTSTAAKFSILFPTKPQITTTKLDIPNENLYQNTFSIRSQTEEYGVVVTDLNKYLLGLSKAEAIGLFLDDLGDKTERKPIVLDGENGFETLSKKENQKTKLRILIKNGKVYEIFFYGSDEKVNSPEVKAFFDSFKFINSTPAKGGKN
ncbi:MAG: hypothetical protein K1X72_20905 [Pyrinomonadaceae bacterium]|nr:hypothetical protein [Pyrinomonadaceae bacterium]